MNECVFCEIVAGDAPVSLVYKDELCSAFLDIQPVNPGHLMVIPNRHAPRLENLDADIGAHLFRIAQRMADALYKSGVQCDGVNLFLADGEAAFQDVFHVHLHVFPRFRGDGFSLDFSDTYFRRPERSDLDNVARKIRAALEQGLDDGSNISQENLSYG